MLKNTASQIVGAQMVSAADGSAFTGSVTVYVTGDGGTQAAGSVGSGACTHEGNGFHTYAPAQAETNYDHVAFTFVGTGAVPATVQVYPITLADYKATGFSTHSASDVSTQIQSDLATEIGYLDAAVSSRAAPNDEMDLVDAPNATAVAAIQNGLATPTNITAGTITTVTNLTNAPTNGDLTATMKTSVTTAATAATPNLNVAYDAAKTAASQTSVDTIDGNVDAILADTNELQTDWANGGRLDLILDARASQTSVDDIPTNSELATALGNLNDLDSTEAQAAAAAALTAYDPPTKAELDSAVSTIRGADSDTLKTLSDQIDGVSGGGGDATEAKQDQIIAAVALLSGGVAGAGADDVTITIQEPDSDPIADCAVWVTSDAAGATVVAGTLWTDDAGQVTFKLDDGVTYYLWARKSSEFEVNGSSFVAEADV